MSLCHAYSALQKPATRTLCLRLRPSSRSVLSRLRSAKAASGTVVRASICTGSTFGAQAYRTTSFASSPRPTLSKTRTNGGAVYETQYTSFDQLPASSTEFANKEFAADEWSENEVWSSQEQMLLSLVPSQGIDVNKMLSSWLEFKFNVPPDYILNKHVFILRLADGTYAALQLANFVSPEGKKCFLTINYKYPY